MSDCDRRLAGRTRKARDASIMPAGYDDPIDEEGADLLGRSGFEREPRLLSRQPVRIELRRYWTMGKQQPCTHAVSLGHEAPSGLSTHWVTPGSHSVPVPAQKIAQASPESPPLFWSPSWAMTWMR